MEQLCFNCFRERADSSGPCPYCGYDPDMDRELYPEALPHGSLLADQYITGRVLGQGGFGITYVALDQKLQIKVAVKEYLPDMMAGRSAGSLQVTAYTGERGGQYQYGLEQFLEEARVLAKFNGNPNIVGVRSFFEQNGTAYFVMDYITGTSFKTHLSNHGGRVSWEEAVRILTPVMDALSAVHKEGIIHRDVTPDNIYITSDGQVKLLDFGAARYSLGDRSRSLDVVLKPGYAPKEQYTRKGRQGPYTDVYSLSACFYAAITGVLPPESLDRMEEDDLVPPSARGIAIPQGLEDVILYGLEVRAEDRYQTMEEFRAAVMITSSGLPETGVVEPEQMTGMETWAHGLTEQISGEYFNNDMQSDGELEGGPKAALNPKSQPGAMSESGSGTDTTPFSGHVKALSKSAKVTVSLVACLAIVLLARGLFSAPADESGVQNTAPAGNTVGAGTAATNVETTMGNDSEREPVLTGEASQAKDTVPSIQAPTQTPAAQTPEPQTSARESTSTPTQQSTSVPMPTPGPTSTPVSNSDFTIENGVLIKYNGSGGVVTIPDGVIRIGQESFEYCSSLTSVTIPNSVTSISYSAFYGCSNLTSVTIPNSVTKIDEKAFEKCSSLTSVTIPNSVTRIREQTFQNCSSLTSVTIPKSVTEICWSAFEGCKGLTSVTIPNSVTDISYRAFCGCSSLTSVTIPNSVTSISYCAFYGCSNLTNVTIPDSVSYIGVAAFEECSSLASVTIPNSVSYIGGDAFYGCSSLTDVYYNGSEAQWRQIDITDNDLLYSVTIHFGG